MKHIEINARDSGSILVGALLMAIIIGFTLGSYLLWVGSQNVLTRESHAWNAALVVAEAGIEEGMAQINYKFGTNLNLAANAWGGPPAGPYGPIQRDLIADSSTNGYYKAYIVRAANGLPIVYSTGYTMVPLVGKPIARVIEVQTALSPAFPGGMAALKNITFNGNNVTIDSYDSMDPDHSTPTGMYDPNKRKAGGDVASSYGFVNVGNANVNGKIRTGPDGNYSTGPQGWAGDLDWHGPGVQPGWYANDFNADFKDAALPDGFTPLPLAPVTGDTNMYYIGSGDYSVSSITMRNKNDNIVVAGIARVYVSGEVSMSGLPAIYIKSGASLELYVAGPSTVLTYVNTEGNANTFKYFGLPTNTSLKWNGNASYVGTVYAPQATFTLGGGGSTVMDYQGACVVKSVTLDGHFNFHYDEALRRRGFMAGYHANSWRELPPPNGL